MMFNGGANGLMQNPSRSLIAFLTWIAVSLYCISLSSIFAVAQPSNEKQIDARQASDSVEPLPSDCAKLWPILWEGMKKKEKPALFRARRAE